MLAALTMVGMADYLERGCHTLSGGQKQRVAIAGALVQQPKVGGFCAHVSDEQRLDDYWCLRWFVRTASRKGHQNAMGWALARVLMVHVCILHHGVTLHLRSMIASCCSLQL